MFGCAEGGDGALDGGDLARHPVALPHEQVAVRDVCAGLVAREPQLREDVLFGVATSLHLDAVTGARMLERWDAASVQAGTTSLVRVPVGVPDMPVGRAS